MADYDPSGTFGAIGAALIALIGGGFWVRDKLNKSSLDAGSVGVAEQANGLTKQSLDGAGEVITTLREQITAMGADIREIKETHKKEKEELEKQLDQLRADLNKMSFRMGHIRAGMVDAYAMATAECSKTGCRQWEALAAQLKKLIEEDL